MSIFLSTDKTSMLEHFFEQYPEQEKFLIMQIGDNFEVLP